MKKNFITATVLSLLLAACAKPTDHGQQYVDGNFDKVLNPVDVVVSEKVSDYSLFPDQLAEVENNAPKIVEKFDALYSRVLDWRAAGGIPTDLTKYGISIQQMGGGDNQGNVLFTGYFSPVIEMSRQPTAKYRYPVYKMPNCNGKCPTRAEIYAGALDGQGLELGYSASLIDNFIMEVQGSGFVKFTDSEALEYFAYGGKNGHAYVSIGRILIERDEVERKNMSLKAIEEWVKRNDEQTVLELLNQNTSFVFFNPKSAQPVMGAAEVPLLAGASVAADPKYLPMGSVLLAEVPQLDAAGKWTGQHVLKLLMALDKGGAVKQNHLDLYHGTGAQAGTHAGHHKHFGRVWRLNSLTMPEIELVKDLVNP